MNETLQQIVILLHLIMETKATCVSVGTEPFGAELAPCVIASLTDIHQDSGSLC